MSLKYRPTSEPLQISVKYLFLNWELICASACKQNLIIWEGYHESGRCLRDTYPESYITTFTSIRRQTIILYSPVDVKWKEINLCCVWVSGLRFQIYRCRVSDFGFRVGDFRVPRFGFRFWVLSCLAGERPAATCPICKVLSKRAVQLPWFIPNAAGFRRTSVQIKDLKKTFCSSSEGWWMHRLPVFYSEFQVSNFQVSGLEFRISCFVFRDSGFEFRDSSFGNRVSSFGLPGEAGF